MNILRFPKLLITELYFQHADSKSLTSFGNISIIASSAFSLLSATLKSVHEKITLRIWVPLTEPEKELTEICNLAVSTPGKENDEDLIQKARNLIRKGVAIHSDFKYEPYQIAWLREHCAEELRERAALSIKGLELIDFETMLPPDWQPPEWLPPPEKLEVSENTVCKYSPLEEENQYFLNIREFLRPLAQKINNSWMDASFTVLTGFVMQSLLQNQCITIASLCLQVITANAIKSRIFLNQNDMQRLHAKAMQNPLYNARWCKAESSAPIVMEFMPISTFLKPGWSRDDVAQAHYNFMNRKINICEELSVCDAFEALIFESAHAFQHNRFIERSKVYCQGKLGKEEAARSMEYIEWESLCIYHQIMDLGREKLGWPENMFTMQKKSSFLSFWEGANMRFPLDKKNSHSDSFRQYWEEFIESSAIQAQLRNAQ